MTNFIQQFKDLFKNPEEKEKMKVEEKKRLDTLHKQARKPFKKTKLTVEDFERAQQIKKKKEPKKPISYTF